MRKRRLAVSLLLLGLTFVFVLHIVLAYAFGTGLQQLSLLGAGLCIFGILFVNFGLPAPAEESAPGSDD